MKKIGFIDEILRLMDRDEIDYSLLIATPGLSFRGYEMGNNKDVLKAVKAYPDRFIGCMYIDPRSHDSIETITQYSNEGFKCIKLFPPVGFYPDEPRFAPVFEYINELKLPVLCHTGQTNIPYVHNDSNRRQATNSVFAQPIYLDGPARLYPDITFIIAHMGYPFNLQAWSVSINPNVYLDLSGAGSWVLSSPAIYNGIGRCIPVDFKKVLWGSDNTLEPAESIELIIKALKDMGMPEECCKYVLGGTAQRILRL
jgi:predicted TIM-barrel fold metal-dependent hydrolase